MWKTRFQPRFSDTDALGHINNAAMLTWLEHARRPFFEIFIPDLDPKKWNLIIAKLEIDYLAQTYYQTEVEIQTSFERIGNSSMVLLQEIFQDNKKVAKCKAIIVHFDYQSNSSKAIPEPIRKELTQHMKVI
jgi:acyl-CoA thioester hydrolase